MHMKCIDDELIQKYIDNEASQEEASFIEEHLRDCVVCDEAVDKQKKLAVEIRNALNLFCDKAIGVPTFIKPLKNKQKTRRKMLRWAIGVASAACILFFVSIFLKHENNTLIDTASFLHDVEYEFDANRSILQQDLVITIIDNEGNVSKYAL